MQTRAKATRLDLTIQGQVIVAVRRPRNSQGPKRDKRKKKKKKEKKSRKKSVKTREISRLDSGENEPPFGQVVVPP